MGNIPKPMRWVAGILAVLILIPAVFAVFAFLIGLTYLVVVFIVS